MPKKYLIFVYKVLEFLKSKIYDEIFTFPRQSDTLLSAS